MPVRRRRPLGPKGQLIATVIMYVVCAFFAFAVVASHASAAQSSYVQNHGVPESATVLNVDNSSSTYKGNTTWTALVTVQLQQPVDGTTTSTVHVPYQDNSNTGDTITVLVDPGNPGYSELPGSPSTTNGAWIWLLVFAVLTFVIAVMATRRTVRLFRQRRAAGSFGTVNYAPR